MGAFDIDAESVLYGALITAWVSFIGSVESILAIHNHAHPEFPASLKERTEDRLLVQCRLKGNAFSYLTISVFARLCHPEFQINCRVQKWSAPPGAAPKSMNSEEQLNFDWRNGSLFYGKEKLDPTQAAERLLERALL